VLTLEQGWELAQAWYHHRLRPDWRRYSVSEAEALFEEVGLTTDFWQLSEG
jgi:hypothetical protein